MSDAYPEGGKMNRKWLQIMGLAVSFPSTILATAWGALHLVDLHILTQAQAIFIIIGIICGMLFLMVYYASKRKS